MYRACFLGHPVLVSPMFNNQGVWREMELCNQRSRFGLTEDRDFIIHGLGLLAQLRLYFEARAQLRSATDELMHFRQRDAVASYDEFRLSERPRSNP